MIFTFAQVYDLVQTAKIDEECPADQKYSDQAKLRQKLKVHAVYGFPPKIRTKIWLKLECIVGDVHAVVVSADSPDRVIIEHETGGCPEPLALPRRTLIGRGDRREPVPVLWRSDRNYQGDSDDQGGDCPALLLGGDDPIDSHGRQAGEATTGEG